MSTSLHGCIHQQLNNARKLCQITIRLKHRSTPLLFAICSLLPSVPPYTKRGHLSNQSSVFGASVINHLFWSPTHAMIIIILDRQHMSWSYSLLIANICHDHNHYRSPTHAMIIIFLTHKIFSQFSSTGLLSCYTQFLTNKVFLFSLMLSVTWWTLLCKSLCQDDH